MHKKLGQLLLLTMAKGHMAQPRGCRNGRKQNICFKICLTEMGKIITDLSHDTLVTTEDSKQTPPKSKSDTLLLK
jgi:hypothetical protein